MGELKWYRIAGLVGFLSRESQSRRKQKQRQIAVF